MENGTVVAEKSKSGNRVWIVLLIVLFVAIVGLIVGIVVVKNTKKSLAMPYTELNSRTADFLYGQRDVDVYNKLAADLKYAIENEKDNYARSIDCVNLSQLLFVVDGFDAAMDVVDDCKVSYAWEDPQLYNLLAQQFSLQQNVGYDSGTIELLDEILSLPENMELEYIDWSTTRSFFMELRNTLEESVHEEE